MSQREPVPDQSDVRRDWSVPVLAPDVKPFAVDAAHLSHQRDWSRRTFGPGSREAGVIDHIRKELLEIETAESGEDKLAEWVDVVILALDGAWRCGGNPQQILDAVHAKQARNEARVWPDWRTMSADKAIEHDRSADRAASDENSTKTED